MTDLAPEARPSYWREQRERQKLVFYILQTFMIFLLYNKLFVKSVRYGQRLQIQVDLKGRLFMLMSSSDLV